MEFSTFDISPGTSTSPSALIARWTHKVKDEIVDRCYGVTVILPRPHDPIANAFRDTDFTETADAIAQWCDDRGIDAAVLEKFAVIYFARAEDRTLFLLQWAQRE